MKTLRVMVADDELHARLLIREIVNALPGIVVAEVDNGGSVLEHYGRILPDLLLLDINMPLKTGDEVVSELLQNYPDARIIILTGLADSETIGQCIDLGAIGYVRKDVEPSEMRERILDMLGDD